MASQFTTENLKRVFVFPFKDDEWVVKLVIWVLLSFGSILIIPMLFMTGYQYEIMHRIIVDRAAPTLPEWDDWGRLLKNGAKYWGVSLVYGLPTFLMIGVPFIGMMIYLVSGGAFENPDFTFFFLPIYLVWSVVGTAIFVLMGLVTTAATGHMIAQGEFAAAFQVKSWWQILKKSIWGYVLTGLMVGGATYIVAFMSQMMTFTVVLACLSPILTGVFSIYFWLISSVLYAQAYVMGVDRVADSND